MHYVPDTGRRAEDIKANDTWALTPKNSQSNGKHTEQTHDFNTTNIC